MACRNEVIVREQLLLAYENRLAANEEWSIPGFGHWSLEPFVEATLLRFTRKIVGPGQGFRQAIVGVSRIDSGQTV